MAAEESLMEGRLAVYLILSDHGHLRLSLTGTFPNLPTILILSTIGHTKPNKGISPHLHDFFVYTKAAVAAKSPH